MSVDEHDIDQPLSLTNKLFLEESSNQTILPAILEEEPISTKSQINNGLDIIKSITNKLNYIENIINLRFRICGFLL